MSRHRYIYTRVCIYIYTESLNQQPQAAGGGKTAALKRYRKRLSMYLRDGILDGDEREALQEEFGTDGITAAEHDMLVAEIRAERSHTSTKSEAVPMATLAEAKAAALKVALAPLPGWTVEYASKEKKAYYNRANPKAAVWTHADMVGVVQKENAAAAKSSCRSSAVASGATFKVGQKLEALDNSEGLMLLCVASIKAIDGPNLLVSFDGWSDKFSYWASWDSERLHPVGYCEAKNLKLQAPKGHVGAFEWGAYLALTGAERAPSDSLLLLSPPAGEAGGGSVSAVVEVGQKLEAFDQKSKDMICVATVTKVHSDSLFIHFDGWESGSYDYWCASSSPFLHTVGYCASVGHNLEPPKHYSGKFDWATYLDATGSVPVPAGALA